MSSAATSTSDYHAIGTEKAPEGWSKLTVGGLAVGALALGAFFWHSATGGPSPPPVTAAAPSSPLPSASPGVRLRVINGCASDPLWIANFAFNAPYFPQDIKLPAGGIKEFAIPDEGLPATRFWAKWGCDEKGSNCAVGQSGGPGESCPPTGCAPPIDSKFEATFGCLPGSKTKCAVNPSDPTQPLEPVDWWDVSQVDGWTLPYKVELSGDCPAAPQRIDCSHLSLTRCPDSEDLGLPGGKESLVLRVPSGTADGAAGGTADGAAGGTADGAAGGTADGAAGGAAGGAAVGCYSPCAKLTYSQWGQGHEFTPESKEAQDYCCPTPPITPEACSTGPVIKTEFVKAVHELCPSVYAYAYDDGVGLAQCPAGTRYDVTFYCP